MALEISYGSPSASVGFGWNCATSIRARSTAPTNVGAGSGRDHVGGNPQHARVDNAAGRWLSTLVVDFGCQHWRAHGESNPGFRRERAAS